MDTSEIKAPAATVPGPVSSSTEKAAGTHPSLVLEPLYLVFFLSKFRISMNLSKPVCNSQLHHSFSTFYATVKWRTSDWTLCVFVLGPSATETWGQGNTQEHGLSTWDWQPKDIALLPFIRKSLCVQIQAKCQPVRALSSLAFVQCLNNCPGQVINKWQSCPWTQSLFTCNSSCLFGQSHFNCWEFILLSHSHPVWALHCK